MLRQRVGPRLSLLILQPDEEIRESLAGVARQSGLFWSVDAMASGRWALDYLSEGLKSGSTIVPDLIVADCELAEMNALQFIEQLRRYEDFHDVYVALLPAEVDVWQHNAADSAGCDFYLQRPRTENAWVALLQHLSEASATKSRPYRGAVR